MDPTCGVPDCTDPPVRSWQREASAAERTAFGVQDGETALVPVYGCDNHRIPDEAACGIHESDCTAPPHCTCMPTYLPTTPLPVSD